MSLTHQQRRNFVKTSHLCFNCLSLSHLEEDCRSKFTCKECHRRHHSLLHIPTPVATNAETAATSEPLNPETQVKVLASTASLHTTVLLATALVSVKDSKGIVHTCRVLLDSASQASFISDSCAKRLGCYRFPSSNPIQGLNQMNSVSSLGTVKCTLTPRNRPQPCFEVDMIVIPNICEDIPETRINIPCDNFGQTFPLADPGFDHPGRIDMLLGADIFPKILLKGVHRGNHDEPNAINTVFGWVLMGKVNCSSKEAIKSFYTCAESSIDNTLKRFWEIEQVPNKAVPSADDILCEEIFNATHSRDDTGRYVVALPFREDTPELGESYSAALRRFLSLEHRLIKDSSLYHLYSLFMKDYLQQGHMALASVSLKTSTNAYYIPHHGVMKTEGESTKLRVVFDASSKSSTGVSLNDILLVGPKLQKDICSILLTFRLHQFVFTADIRQMYRQILVVNHHRDYQRILWRFSNSDDVQEYRLNTVTYGISSSPYLAIRALCQLTSDEGSNYPLAAKAITSSIYVDDIVTGADSIDKALEIQSQLISLFAKAGLELRKWTSNDTRLLASVPETHQQPHVFTHEDGHHLKVLGLQWCPNQDSFSYSVEPISRPCTKRNVLSEVARIYDPLGLLSPLTIFAKHVMQSLWSLGLEWDDEPPDTIKAQWLTYKSQLENLSKLMIPRCLLQNTSVLVELHRFCDASEIGYAGVIYLRQVTSEGQVSVSLICAKSKVAPLKRVTIPRLELCAAVLLSDLFKFVLATYESVLSIDRIYAWSDSLVTLSWIRASPHKWKTFVANRVSHIQERVPPNAWSHVAGVDNPADCASRGLMPNELISHSLWWTGPQFLTKSVSDWPTPPDSLLPNIASEEQRVGVYTAVVNSHWIDELCQRFSSLPKLQRIVGYCLRFKHNALSPANARCDHFTLLDLQHSLSIIVRTVQHTVFRSDIALLRQNRTCSKPLRKLSPFLDQEGILRVGGRLRHSELRFDAKHPMLLPRSHPLTVLIIRHFHEIYLHPGLRTLQCLLAQQFWILSPRRAIHHVISHCYQCFRVKPISLTPQMGDLPPSRVSQLKPFSHSGVDFAGPVRLTVSKHRGAKSVKGYICVFVCFATKALHLEVVSDLSSAAFLAALRRFTARRGRCSHLYSDCGTNFIGANRLLKTYGKSAAEQLTIEWHFNPPSAPHFGGLWESGVKSVKSHLIRVIGDQVLTYEELSTVLCQVEAVLNSRPLCTMSNDPNDLSVLTPGHFLTLEPLSAPPDDDVTSSTLPRLNRWQLVQRMHQDFWYRWRREYLHTLQQKQKWNEMQSSPQVGDLVLIRDEIHPPLTWKFGRIQTLYPGKDGVARVARVQTSTGVLRRPLTKLCRLPSQ